MFDVDAIGLTNIVNNLNHGLDIGGNPMGSQTALLLGVGANPGALNMDEEIRRFELEGASGRGIRRHAAGLRPRSAGTVPASASSTSRSRSICGIWPLTSFRNAEFMVNELRVPVPEHFMERMRRADNAEKARAEGIKIAREMVERVRRMVQGVQLSAPFGRYQMAIEVAEAIGAAVTMMATDLIEIDAETPDPDAIEPGGGHAPQGRVVAIPTDALYTLVADPFNLHAVGRVFRRQGPRMHRSLPLLINDSLMAEDLARELSARFYLLARHFWPGPLTMIVPASREFRSR